MTRTTLQDPGGQALRDAWASMRQRACLSHWPQEFDAVMADPTRCRLVQLEASARARSRPCVPALPVAAPLFRSLRPLAAPCVFDRKRAAAGERDDD